jgi:exonuclease 1
MLIYFGVKPYLVFDGDDLPSKAGTESNRLAKREASKSLAMELYNKGRIPEAYQEFQKAVDVTPYMARQLIEELKKMTVQYVVAPYEADAQLVYLEKLGIINGIISEDSDLLVFGAKRLLSKLDQHGECVEVNRGDFTSCRDISLIGWTDANFRHMCILSGCDYLASIPKMGLKTAYRNIRKYKNIEKITRILQFEGSQVPANYLENFKQAELTFQYQRVFCPKNQKLVTLHPLEAGLDIDKMTFIGHDVKPEIAVGVACGDLDPMTKDPIDLKPSIAPRHPPSLLRRQTLASSADLKPSRPIDSFFTPKRVPLAELDPNSLTPSPSQQHLLERHTNSSWQPSPVTRLTRSASSLPATRRSIASPAVSSVQRESFLTCASDLSAEPVAKRQRLCADVNYDDDLPTRSTESRSRFFRENSKADRGTPSLKLTKKARKSNFGVFSDEIAEDIMCHLIDNEPNTQKVQNMTVIQKSADSVIREKLPLPEDSHATTKLPAESVNETTSAAPLQHESEPRVTIATPGNVDVDSRLFNEVEAHSKNPKAGLQSKYAFHTELNSSIPEVEARANKLPSTPTPLRRVSSSIGMPLQRRLTPLQRLGRMALAHSRSIEHLDKQTSSSNSHGCPEIASLSSESLYESSWSGTTQTQGSEDLLVPFSDEDGESDEPIEQKTATVPNLRQFSFIPR